MPHSGPQRLCLDDPLPKLTKGYTHAKHLYHIIQVFITHIMGILWMIFFEIFRLGNALLMSILQDYKGTIPLSSPIATPSYIDPVAHPNTGNVDFVLTSLVCSMKAVQLAQTVAN